MKRKKQIRVKVQKPTEVDAMTATLFDLTGVTVVPEKPLVRIWDVTLRRMRPWPPMSLLGPCAAVQPRMYQAPVGTEPPR